MIYIKKIMKKPKIKLINILVIIVAVMFIFIILNRLPIIFPTRIRKKER